MTSRGRSQNERARRGAWMSLTLEIAFARIAAAEPGPVAVLSAHGLGSPLAACAPDTARLAVQPLGGLMRAPVSMLAPPVAASAPDAARIARRARLFVDARWSGDALAMASALRAGPPDALRCFGPAPKGMIRVMNRGDEGLWLLEAPSPHLAAALAALDSGEADLFDALNDLKGGWFVDLRHAVEGAEMSIEPVWTLERPDERQIDQAVGAGRAVLGGRRVTRLALPVLGGGAQPFGLTVSGLAPAAPDPVLVNPPLGWAARATREGGRWRLRVETGGRREAMTPGIWAPKSPDAELAETWVGIGRGDVAPFWREDDELSAFGIEP